jgi:hypothetical protein
VPGELQQVVAFVEGEPQRAGERCDGLRGRTRAAALLQSRVEVGRHVRKRRDEPWCHRERARLVASGVVAARMRASAASAAARN